MTAEVVPARAEAAAQQGGLIRDLLARVGVGGRLLLAFLGISIFAVLAAAAGMMGFLAIGESLDRITEERVPAALNALALSRQAERIVAAAPAILTAESPEDQEALAAEIEQQTDRAYQLLAELQEGALDRELVEPLAQAVDGLSGSLRALQAVQRTRLQIRAQKQVLLAGLAETHRAMDALIAPWLLVVDEEIQNVRRGLEDRDLPEAARAAAFQQLDDTNETLRALQAAKVTASLFKDRVHDAANVTAEQDLRVAKFRLAKLDQELAAFAEHFDPRLEELFAAEHEKLRATISGPDNIIDVQARDLGLLQDGAMALALNVELSQALQGTVDALVARSRGEIDEARAETARVQRFSGAVFVGAVGLSLLSSVLVVWLYVGRRIVRRLRTLSDSMLAIASGNLRAPLPATAGNDEIAGMAKALSVFRDTAVEVEENNLREIATARQRLIDAIESTSEGFAFYDADDRLMLSNQRYHELLHGGSEVDLTPGTPFEAIIRQAVERGLIEDAAGDPEGWIQERIGRHRNPGEPQLQRRRDGRWVQISERRIAGGGTVAVFSDLTELKESEQRAAAANRLIMESLRYASRIQSAVLPARDALSWAVKEHFLIWEPRDVVGGDFFWFQPAQGGYVVIVGDCTGHGVPGAFMTLIACGMLDRIWQTVPADEPSRMLSELHRGLQMLLGQDQGEGETDDGLEAGVCFVSEAERRLVFSGARFSLWRASDGAVDEIKGDKAGIGYRRFAHDTRFRDVPVELTDGAAFYLTTDGLIDQIGGPRHRSFGKKRFSAFVADQHARPMPEQAEALRQTLGAYQGEQVRRDDVTVLGFAPNAA